MSSLHTSLLNEAHLTAQEAAKAISSDLKSLETRKVDLGMPKMLLTVLF